MDVKEKNNIAQKNVETSLANLAQLLGIPLKRRWKKELAEFFGVAQSLLPQWVKRGNIPDDRREFAVKKGYPLESWLREELPTPYANLVDVAQDHPERQRSPGAMSYSLDDDHLEDQSPRWVHMRVLAEHHPVVEKVQKILESDEKQTIKALVSNVDVFHEKVVVKRELMNVILEQGKKLEQASWHMKNQDRELAAMRQDLDGLLGRDVKKN